MSKSGGYRSLLMDKYGEDCEQNADKMQEGAGRNPLHVQNPRHLLQQEAACSLCSGLFRYHQTHEGRD